MTFRRLNSTTSETVLSSNEQQKLDDLGHDKDDASTKDHSKESFQDSPHDHDHDHDSSSQPSNCQTQRYKANELLSKRNGKATKAHQTFSVSKLILF